MTKGKFPLKIDKRKRFVKTIKNLQIKIRTRGGERKKKKEISKGEKKSF